MQHDLADLRKSVGLARLATYERAVDGSLEMAVDLYRWNIDVSGEMFKLLAIVEVVLRNTITNGFKEADLASGGDGNWLLGNAVIKFPRQRDAVERATHTLRALDKPLTLDALVPELSFGFWRYLLTKRYADLFWTTVFRPSFPFTSNGEQRALFDRVGRLHRLRNRIAHHEPIFSRRLDLDYRDCLFVIGAVCPVTAAWAAGQSRVPQVLEVRPPV